jgi:hypothetical protein
VNTNDENFEARRDHIVEELKYRFAEYHEDGDSLKKYAYKVLVRGTLTPEQMAAVLEALEPVHVQRSRGDRPGLL